MYSEALVNDTVICIYYLTCFDIMISGDKNNFEVIMVVFARFSWRCLANFSICS